MKTWLKMGAVGVLAFVLGWYASLRTFTPRFERCHEALRFMSKGASLERLSESSKILLGE